MRFKTEQNQERLQKKIGRIQRRTAQYEQKNRNFNTPFASLEVTPFAGVHSDVACAKSPQIGNKNINVLVEPGDIYHVPNGRDMANQSSFPGYRQGQQLIENFNNFPYAVDHGHFTAPVDRYMDAVRVQEAFYRKMFAQHQRDVMQIKTGRQMRRHAEMVRRGDSAPIAGFRGVEGFYEKKENWKKAAREILHNGVRVFGLMWNPDSIYGKGADINEPGRSPAEDTGLTDDGRQLVRYLATRHIIIDVSHSSKQTSLDILNVLDQLTAQGIPHAPAIATHSGSKTVTDHERNLDDEVALRLDFIGIPFISFFVKKTTEVDPFSQTAGVDNVVEHLKYFKKLKILHKVGLGPDFDGAYPEVVIKGLEVPQDVRQTLITALVNSKTENKRDFTDEEIQGILYLNAERVLLNNLPRNFASIPVAAMKENFRTAREVIIRRGREMLNYN